MKLAYETEEVKKRLTSNELERILAAEAARGENLLPEPAVSEFNYATTAA